MNTMLIKTGQILAMLCLSTSLLNGTISEQNLPNVVGIDAITEEEHHEMKQQLLTEETGEEPNEDDMEIQQRIAGGSYYFFNQAEYTITSFGYQGESVVISEGSTWSIRPNDKKMVESWNNNRNQRYNTGAPTRVLITKNNDWFSNRDYPFRMYNVETYEYAYCKMTHATPSEEKTVRINYIEYDTGRVELAGANGITVYFLCRDDYPIYSKWKGGQRIVLGVNSGWFRETSTYPLMLINVNTVTMARCALGQ